MALAPTSQYADPKTVRPVVIGANGRPIPHPCFQGWSPAERRDYGQLIGRLFFVACLGVFVAMLLGATRG
jgi:hypothetical protein